MHSYHHRALLSTTTILSSKNDNNNNENKTNIKNNKKITTTTDVDGGDLEEYWNNRKIHTLGNTGTLGGLHAAMGPISTILIDKLAYNGVNVRTKVKIFKISKNITCIQFNIKVNFDFRFLKHYMIW